MHVLLNRLLSTVSQFFKHRQMHWIVSLSFRPAN